MQRSLLTGLKMSKWSWQSPRNFWYVERCPTKSNSFHHRRCCLVAEFHCQLFLSDADIWQTIPENSQWIYLEGNYSSKFLFCDIPENMLPEAPVSSVKHALNADRAIDAQHYLSDKKLLKFELPSGAWVDVNSTYFQWHIEVDILYYQKASIIHDFSLLLCNEKFLWCIAWA